MSKLAKGNRAFGGIDDCLVWHRSIRGLKIDVGSKNCNRIIQI